MGSPVNSPNCCGSIQFSSIFIPCCQLLSNQFAFLNCSTQTSFFESGKCRCNEMRGFRLID